MLSTSTNTSQKPKILENIININKYQSIPSIPSNIHAYGYNENESTSLHMQKINFNSTNLLTKFIEEKKKILLDLATTISRKHPKLREFLAGLKPKKKDYRQSNNL